MLRPRSSAHHERRDGFGTRKDSRTKDTRKFLCRLGPCVRDDGHSGERIEGPIDPRSGTSAVLATNYVRLDRIEYSFVSSGVSGEEPQVLVERLNAMGDAEFREISWRLRELERDTLLRASAPAAADGLALPCSATPLRWSRHGSIDSSGIPGLISALPHPK